MPGPLRPIRYALLAAVIAVAALVPACSDEDQPTTPDFLGRLTVKVAGFPPQAPAPVSLQGPGGLDVAIPATTDLGLVPPGAYVLTAQQTPVGFGDYYPDAGRLTLDLAGGDEQILTVTYYGREVRGGLVAVAEGLPDSTDTVFEVLGPGGFSATIGAGDSLSTLQPGAYQVSGPRAVAGGQLYAPWPEAVPADVIAGRYTDVTLHYGALHDVDLDLVIERLELTQATQRLDGSVPLVAGREAVLRVHGVATAANADNPEATVEVYRDGALVRSATLARAADSVPVAPDPEVWHDTWNLHLTADEVAPGLGLRAILDPEDTVLEASEANNRYPAAGLLEPVVVQRPVVPMRLVPVYQTSTGLQGDATEANAPDWVADARLLMPTPEVDVDLHPVYTTDTEPLVSDNANNSWVRILVELAALRAAEDNGGRHYYGAVRVDYTSGIAGLGRLPGFVAMGWDAPESRASVLAHELGHNLGLAHADCGHPDGPDPLFPYPDGQIGAWGLDVVNELPKHPVSTRDLMSYCQPKWISDYMYEKVMELNPVKDARGAPTACLLVWGYRAGSRLVLEPAFTVTTAPRLPQEDGPYRLEVLDAEDRALAEFGFDLTAVADLPGSPGIFCWAVPLPAGKAEGLEQLRLTGPEGVRERTSASAKAAAAPTLQRQGDLAVRWDRQQGPMVMVRRADDGAVIGLLRQGDGVVRTPAGPLDLVLSDGVRSRTWRIDAP